MNRSHIIISLITLILIVVAGICDVTTIASKCDPPRHMCGIGANAYCAMKNEQCKTK